MAASNAWLLVIAGLVAGFIDSIAGGGGLITLPALMHVLGPGADAIGTNKIAGSVAALAALFVYHGKGHLDLRRSIAFALWVAWGSFCGSRVAPWLPPRIFPWVLAVTVPCILYLVWRKELWVPKAQASENPGRRRASDFFSPPVIVAGMLVGFYDGAWGPGGGTLMFLALLFVVKFPLLPALAGARFVNAGSALTALASYAVNGHVKWGVGAAIALGIGAGALFGAHHATKQAARIVRPVLAVVASLLLALVLRTYG